MAFVRRLLLCGIAAGLLAALVVSVLQAHVTTPLILEAERYEHGAGAHSHADAVGLVDEPAAGLGRHAQTFLANAVIGAGFGLILVAAVTLRGRPVDPGRGLLWGVGGFAAFALAPALGLPPQLPGAAEAALYARQGWWLLAVASTAGGLWLLAFGRRWRWLGLGLLALPHLLGAPPPATLEGPLPDGLTAHFVAASLVTSAVFWATLGTAAGWLLGRSEGSRAACAA